MFCNCFFFCVCVWVCVHDNVHNEPLTNLRMCDMLYKGIEREQEMTLERFKLLYNQFTC